MKKASLKLLSLLVLVVFVSTSLLTGCGSSKNIDTEQKQENSTATVETKKEETKQSADNSSLT